MCSAAVFPSSGGDVIDIESINGDSFGYRALNIEPNPGSSQTPDHIRITHLRASQMQVAGDPAQPVGKVQIERADFDSRYQTNSQPGYSDGRIGFAGRGMAALIATNVQLLEFGSVRANAYEEMPFIFGESAYKSHVKIKQLSIAGSGANARRRGLLHEVGTGGLASLVFGGVHVAGNSVSRPLFTGNPAALHIAEKSLALPR
jgi:hypothetical protein